MKKKTLVFLMLVVLSLITIGSEAAIRRYCMVKYETEDGWSKTYTVEVTFMTGFELNNVTHSFNYGTYDKYCLIWWDKGEVAILKIKDYLIVGSEFTRDDFRNAFSFRSSLNCEQVNDEDATKWQIIGKNYLQFVDPRENE